MWSHIFLFRSLPRRRPPEFTAILMFEFWREATATSVPGLLCQSGRLRPENVSILSSLMTWYENVKLAILEAMVKGYYECSFAVGVGEKSIGPFLIIETLCFNL